MATIPSGISEGALDRAVTAFTAVLGSDRVLVGDDAHVEDFRDPFQPKSWDRYLASAVVQPETTEEVQAIVRIANEHRIPLWTHSTGKNNGYGGAAPGYPGAVTVSLRRMTKVLEINEELGYVEVEPGVSWRMLYEALRDGGHKLLASTPDLGWGSVVGNTLEHGISYSPTALDYQAPCGLEVVTPTGEVLRTGMGAMEGNPAWHTYKRSFGPSIDTLFMQSNLGIVTKMGYWLVPAPEFFIPVWGRVWKDEDIVKLVDVTRKLGLDRSYEGVPIMLNTVLLASLTSRRKDFYTGEGAVPDPIIDKIAKQLEIGRWMFRVGLYGREEKVDMQFRHIKEAIEGEIDGAEVWGTKTAWDDIPKLTHPSELVIGGVPNIETLHMVGWYNENEGGHLDFASVIPLVGKEVYKVHNMLRETLEREAGLDFQVGSTVVNPRTTLHVGLITFDAADEEASKRCYDTLKMMVGKVAEMGYGEYRSHVDMMDEIQRHYSFNNGIYRRFIEQIKDAVDPNGILMPGKQGIWPKHLRGDTGDAAG